MNKSVDWISISRAKIYLAVCLTAIGIYLFPYIYFGSDATLRIHDNLDSNYTWYKVLLDSGTLFSSNSYKVDQLMNGVTRSSLPSEFNFLVLLYAAFGPYGAYVVNQALIRLIGFLGMCLLLKHHVIPGEKNSLIRTGVALCFALLPFWPFGGLSTAGVPLVVYAFLNIRKGNYAWFNWVVLLLYPAYSSLVLSGFYLLFIFGLLWLYDFYHKRKVIPALGAILLISMAYLFKSYRLFFSFILDGGFVSHRAEFYSEGVGLIKSLNEALSIFSHGHSHAISLHSLIIIPIVFLTIIFLRKYLNDSTRKKYILLLTFIVISSLWYGILRLEALTSKESIGSVMMGYFPMQMDRFYMLLPAFWMVLFAISLSTLLKFSKKMLIVVAMILTSQAIYASSYHELFRFRNGPCVSAFYATEQFDEISNYIGKEKSEYRVASLGIHPVIAQYNGFYTLDGYIASYPLSYKHQFREIIKGELEKNPALKKYYDTWGSRVYLFSSELKEKGAYVMNRAGNDFEISNLDINKTAFRDMGGRFILSAVKVNEENNPDIVFKKSFKTTGSAWDIYLYEVQ